MLHIAQRREVALTGESLLHYEILEKIGEGGMGVVHKALDTRLDRLVAIKTLPSIGDPKRRQQFIWEARAAAKLRHPNIVVVYDIASDENREFIVMEYIPGGTLSEKLARGPLPEGEALRYAGEIASALETAHAAGIVHRDLKPSNVLITPEGSVKLVDFGVARIQEQDFDSESSIRAIAGTCGYMSPEQAQGERATAQSDIFSFGAVLYEMVTGQRAFRGKSAASVLAAVLRDDPPRAASITNGLPAALERIIERCLRKDTNHRFQHMGDVRLELEEINAVSLRSRSPIPVFWRRALLYGTLAVVPVLAGWLMFNRHTEPEANSMPIPLTSFPGEETNAAWSPDGRQVAFDWDGEKQDNVDIYLMQPGSSQTLRLTTDPGNDKDPAWSPDGREIAYAHTAADKSTYSLNLVSPLGGPPRILFASATLIGNPNWMPDGRTVLAEMVIEPKQPTVVSAIALDTGKRRQLTWPAAGTPGDLGPAISPDGRTLAFTRKTAWRTAELYLLDLNRDVSPLGKPRRVTDLGYVARPAWTPDGDRILFEAHREGVGIWQVDRSGKNPRPVFGVPNTASVPAIARRPGGRMSLIFTSEVGRFSIWRHSTERGPGGRPVELAPSTRSESIPHYSNDGKKLAFSSTRSGFQEIWVANADGSQPVQLTNLRHQLTEVGNWSPSDDRIAFVSQNRGSRQIYVVHSSGGPATLLTDETGITYGSGWTLDGRGYYYFTLRAGKYEIWKVSSSGGQPELIAQDGMNGFESQRGIFYYWRQKLGQDGPLIRRTAGREEEVPLTPPACGGCVTTPRREGVYYRTTDSSIYLFDEGTGRSVRVFKRPSEPFNAFTISPDGRWFATQFLTSQSVDLMIMERFH